MIDVNSGNRKGADGQESNALATNIEAAKEIARVLHPRDMGVLFASTLLTCMTAPTTKLF